MDNLYHYDSSKFIPYSVTTEIILLKCLPNFKLHIKHDLIKKLRDDPRLPKALIECRDVLISANDQDQFELCLEVNDE
jgi:hypothetical protein